MKYVCKMYVTCNVIVLKMYVVCMQYVCHMYTYIHTLLARPHGVFQSQFYITKL